MYSFQTVYVSRILHLEFQFPSNIPQVCMHACRDDIDEKDDDAWRCITSRNDINPFFSALVDVVEIFGDVLVVVVDVFQIVHMVRVSAERR